MRKQYRILALIGLLSFVNSLPLLAQATPPNPNPPPPGLPIDAFIWLGFLVAIGYGVYVYLERSRRVIARRDVYPFRRLREGGTTEVTSCNKNNNLKK